MARNHFVRLTLVASTIFGLFSAALAWQAKQDVRIEFEVDGVSSKAPDRIEFYDATGKLVLTEPIRDGTFKAPEIAEPLEVRLQFKGRNLAFPEVYPSKFLCSWRVGIDLPPLDPDRMSEGWKGRKPKEVWYIEFSPPDGDGTILEIAVF